MKIDINKVKVGNTKYVTKSNEVCINTYNMKDIEFFENQIVNMIIGNNKFRCQISYINKKSDKYIYISKRYEKYIEDVFKIDILPIKNYKYHSYTLMKMDCLANKKIIISKNIYNKIFYNKNIKYMEIVNNLNGYVLMVDKKDVEADDCKDNMIRISKKYRMLLDLELPTYINSSYIDKLELTDSSGIYTDENKNIVVNNFYNQCKELKEIIKRHSQVDTIAVYPVEKIKERENIFKLFYEFVLGIIIGQTELEVRVIRPSEIDESENVVRLTKSSMKLLGIEETDTIDIYNGNNKIRARVLEFDGFNSVKNNNRLKDENELNITIAIPAYLRKELNLCYINRNVIVKRNLNYFFRKYLNNQIMTIIGLLLSFSFIDRISNEKYKVLTFLLLLLVMIYISFSEIRERITNK